MSIEHMKYADLLEDGRSTLDDYAVLRRFDYLHLPYSLHPFVIAVLSIANCRGRIVKVCLSKRHVTLVRIKLSSNHQACLLLTEDSSLESCCITS
jgi:hypothetical protein